MVHVVPAFNIGPKTPRHLRCGIIAVAGSVAIVVGSPTANAGSAPYVATDLGAKQHPRTLITHQPGVTYRFTSLRWRSWGRPRPKAHGQLTACANMTSCEKLGSARIELRWLRPGRCETVRGRYYVRGMIIQNAKKTPLDLDPSYVC